MKNKFQIPLIICLSGLLQACAPSSYMVKEPVPSKISYTNQSTNEANLTFVDKRHKDSKVFSHGVLKADLILNGSPINPISFLETETAKELNARGVKANILEAGDIKIDVNKFEMRNHRTNAYTPFISFTMLSADVSANGKKERITAYIKRGKVPVWSFDEIIQPTLNEPLDLLVKEFSAKLNRSIEGKKISDDEVKSLVEKINKNLNDGATYMDVYQLGFGNNDTAIPFLVDYTKSESEYIRLAAISSLGILKAQSEMPLLKEIYSTADNWSDKAMALKAIGDIGTPDALNFLVKTEAKLAEAKEKEQLWTKEIIGLYL